MKSLWYDSEEETGRVSLQMQSEETGRPLLQIIVEPGHLRTSLELQKDLA